MPETGTAIRVVVVDDDVLYLSSLGELIEQQPELTVVGTAGNGIEAIELAEQVAPDAIVIDLHMPRLDGVSAVARLRSDHPSMCLIALTGDPSPELQRAATEAGADAVLHKSELLDALFARLAEARPHANGR